MNTYVKLPMLDITFYIPGNISLYFVVCCFQIQSSFRAKFFQECDLDKLDADQALHIGLLDLSPVCKGLQQKKQAGKEF